MKKNTFKPKINENSDQKLKLDTLWGSVIKIHEQSRIEEEEFHKEFENSMNTTGEVSLKNTK